MKQSLLSILFIGALTPASALAVGECPTTFKCQQKGQSSYLITLDPKSGRVWLDTSGVTYQFKTELVTHKQWQQGWRRWPSNFDVKGNANSWTELNINTGELKDISNVGMGDDVRFHPAGTCKIRLR